VWAETSPTAMNCADPANTIADMAMAAVMDNPEVEATAP
jgi:hypothetical protein